MVRNLILVIAGCAAAFGQTTATLDPKTFTPHHILGNIYYVGESDLTSFLITTPKGNILINTGFIYSVPEIRTRIEKLGFKYRDTKILLVTHAHSDHAAGLALIRKQTGARMVAMEQEVPQLESGGKTDHLFGSSGWFDPVPVDRKIKDGETVELGGTVLTAHLTAGHTQGATSYSMDVVEDGRIYHVLLANLPTINEGTRLVRNKVYPSIAKDYAHTFEVLRSLPCDVFLTSHAGQYAMLRKLSTRKGYSPDTFVDDIGLPTMLSKLEDAFRTQLDEETEEDKAYRDYLHFNQTPQTSDNKKPPR